MTKTTAIRDSNIELLRIFAMFLVLVLHANSLVIGIPGTEECQISPANTFVRFLIQSLSIVAVDTFVLISGWFGIRPSIKKLCSLLFQVFFFTLSILAVHCIIHGWNSVTIGAVLKSFMITKCYWFIKSYICLFLISPVLNLFVEKVSRNTYVFVLIGFLGFQTIYGWTDSAPEFFYGYSVISFAGLYLMARYLRIYPPHIIPSRTVCLLCYLALSVLLSLATWLLTKANFHTEHAIPIAFSYINPVIILASLALLYTFILTKIPCSKAINWIAASVFSVYIIHINGFLFHYYRDTVWYLYSTFPISIRWALILCFLALVFIVCVLLDKIRLFTWRKVEKIFRING